ncbi:uncharacterized protein BX664DRAFT_338665 [Halteromyces radiatus]|uniref:uncharacterized protein n=1 Tax=Halteromyces radiatus TaxID=101107 RepID=UPI00221F1AE1|nr:uncharacterized protein BX664DRAFT_338665 [Halteromyces radiatus]KAI8085160.1 hypothetical protein BX664DRAFT_338665 [Halteromyces radiatus]
MSTIELHAYILPLLHAAKYPANQVCGLLLGKVEKDSITHVTTALPLFHHWTTLTPMLDMALQQAELYAKKKQLQIIGWYQANERVDDVSLHDNAIKVADAIRQRSKTSRIFIVNNEKLSSLEKATEAYVIYDYQEQQWKASKDIQDQVKQDYLPKLRGLLSACGYQRIIDLDEHLEDVSLDWLSMTELKL